MALTITIPGAVETTTGSTAPAVLTVGVGAPGQGVPSGGTTGQVLQKLSGVSYDTGWLTPSADFITSVTAPLAVATGNLTVDLSAYSTTAQAAALYYPLSGNPSAFLVAADITGKADLASPTFTGTPTLPTGTIGVTQTAGNSTTALATTAFVTTADNLKADLASPALTGNVTITSNSATAALTITQDGAGDILRLNDVSGDTTFTFVDAAGKVNTIASTTASAGLNVAHGAAPTTPVNGDIYTTTSGLFARINASTHQFAALSTNNSFSNASSTYGNSTATGTINVASGATISASTKTLNIGTGGVSGSTTTTILGPVLGASTTTIGATTAASTLNLATGATLTATTKAVNIGTLGVAGSTTNIVIGSTTGTSTTTLQGITNGITQSPGNNTTALATTAFVTAAVPAFATAAQTVTGTSATTALSPSLANFAAARGMHTRFDGVNTTSISGNGAVTTGYYNYREMYTSTTLSVGRAGWFLGVYAFSLAVLSSRADYRKIDFSKKIWLYGRFGTPNSGYLGDANTISYITLGGYTAFATGAMTSLGIGLSKVGGTSSFINLIVHNGTSQTNVATSNAVTATQITDYVIYSDGAGNVTLFLDGVQAATTSAGPTGITAVSGGFYREQVESTITAAVKQIMQCFGGGIIIDG